MIQTVITIIIVAAALGFFIHRAIRTFRNPLKGCEDCDKSCAGCSLEELKKEIALKKTRGK
jgi:hypothetical protein